MTKHQHLPDIRIYAPRDLSKKWYVQWYEGSRRIRKYGDINTGKTYKERMALAEALRDELLRELSPMVSRLEEAVMNYIASNRVIWRRKTWENYRSIATVFFEFLQGAPVTPERVTAFFEQLKQKLHPTTYNKYHTKLNRLLSEVGETGLLDHVPRLRSVSAPARYFQPHQVARLRRAIAEKDPELWLFCQFVYYCFIRPGELRHLKAGDVLMEEREIRLPGEISKNRKTQYVAIPDVFFPELRIVYELSPDDYLFPSRRHADRPVSVNNMYTRHKNILTDLRFGKGYTLYSWKHTGAVACAKAGISIKELQIQLRHHSLDQTDAYLRQMGVKDVTSIKKRFPPLPSGSLV